MLSVGSRDGRKGLGFGFGFGVGADMEETELEEGEACLYQDDDSRIDPDVALSYIDEKLQDVLGHFQKDFEGGVSAENLGAKFGGYGSFLPTYQRSPTVWSHPTTPPKLQNHNLPVEGAHQNSSVPSSATFSLRLGPAFSSSAPAPVSRVSSVDNSVKKDACLNPPRQSVEFSPKTEHSNKLVNSNDQKTLKVRIKIGPDSSSAQRNAEIYSGLGLDMSPSSSFEDSPAESRGLSSKSWNFMDESPTSILQITTSFPIPGGLLLSPLPDNLLRLSKEKKLQGDSRYGSAHQGSEVGHAMPADELSSARGARKASKEKKSKHVEKSGRYLEMKNGDRKDSGNDVTGFSKKEIDVRTPAEGEAVVNAVKLPLLSSSKFGTGDTTKGSVRPPDISGEVNKSPGKDKIFSSSLVKDEAWESVPSQDVDILDKPSMKMISADKILDSKKERNKSNESYNPCGSDLDTVKVGKDLDSGYTGAPKKKLGAKFTSSEIDGVKRHRRKEHLSSGSNRKSKGSQSKGNPAAGFPKEGSNVVSSSASKDKKKNSQPDDYPSKSKLDDVKSRRDLAKAIDNHRDLTGDSIVMQAEDRVDSLEFPVKDRRNFSKPEFFDKEIHTLAENPRNISSGKKIDNQLRSEASRATMPAAPFIENGTVPDVAHPPSVVIKENWVACDKCQTWRLLPFGMEPTVLPEKWLCSMLDWLPGKNSCDFSEEETTKALHAAYQIPITEGQNNMHNLPVAATSGVTMDEARRPDNSHLDVSLRAVPCSVKKKQGSKEASSAANHMSSIHSSSSTKKNQQSSVKSRSLNDVNQVQLDSNHVNKPVFQQLSKSGDLAVDKLMHKQKENHKLLEHSLDGGVAKSSKTKCKREAGQSELRASKKKKADGMYHTDDDRSSDLGFSHPCSSSGGLPTMAPGKDSNSLKNSKHDGRDNFPDSVDKLEDQVRADFEKLDKMNVAVKKRKVKEWQDSQMYLDPRNGHHLHDSRGSMKEETSESERRKEKKASAFKSDTKEYNLSNGDGRSDKKGRVTKILLSGSRDRPVHQMEAEASCYLEKDQQYMGEKNVSQRNLDVLDTSKKDLGYGQPSIAATSSSSKVSGSRKTKNNFQELKGSPVESVSSSPLRLSNPEKLTSSRRDILRKDDVMNYGVSGIGSPRRFSDGEADVGTVRSGVVRKDDAFHVLHHGSLESPVLDYQGKDAGHTSVGKGNREVEPSECKDSHLLNVDANTMGRNDRYHNELGANDHGLSEERVTNGHCRVNDFLPRKSGKGSSSSRSKEKHRSSKSGFDKGKIKLSDSFSEQEDMQTTKSLKYEDETESHDCFPYHQDRRDGKYSSQDKCSVKYDKDEKTYLGKKDSTGKWSRESNKRENTSKFGEDKDSDVKATGRDGKSTTQQNILLDRDGEKSSSRFLADRIDKMDVATGRGKSQFFPHSGDKQEAQSRFHRPVPESASDVLPVDAFLGGGDAPKVSSHTRKLDNQNGACHGNLRHPTPNGLGLRDLNALNAPSLPRKDASGQAAANTALKEAVDLKHTADRLKDPGLGLERTRLYFEAALKFLHAASLFEPIPNEVTRSMSVYGETARLCGFCACEYERDKEMAAAAMAYKCMEVAYMKVVYSKHFTASKDQIELQNTLRVVPPGESPSSSASDVDNLNNQAAVDKIVVTKDNNGSQVAGSHVIVAKNRPTFERLLSFTRDVNSAMEASRRSQYAFAAANASLGESGHSEGISSVKRVLDFSFYDVDGLLRLVRLAMEDISR